MNFVKYNYNDIKDYIVEDHSEGHEVLKVWFSSQCYFRIRDVVRWSNDMLYRVEFIEDVGHENIVEVTFFIME